MQIEEHSWHALLAVYSLLSSMSNWLKSGMRDTQMATERAERQLQSASCRFEEAEVDYRAILAVAPEDPAAWNNLGNTTLAMGRWAAAAEYFGKAASISPQFSFAAANRCLALFADGQVNVAIREMRTVLRRYPDFPDTRAALTAALWSIGKEADAETNWCVPLPVPKSMSNGCCDCCHHATNGQQCRQRVSDPRYSDAQWLKEDRRWPQVLIEALTAFRQVRTIG